MASTPSLLSLTSPFVVAACRPPTPSPLGGLFSVFVVCFTQSAARFDGISDTSESGIFISK